MYAAVTGLSALGTGMQTISNNIANVNTVGFKAARTNYEDLISQSYFSGGSGRVNQRGCGVKVSTIQNIFSQGAFMAGKQDTDMAITGDGFFAVRDVITNTIMYTRNGEFTLNKDGYLENQSGNIVQGWQMSIPKPGQESTKIGAPLDIKITVLNAPPVETSQMKIVTNLNADDEPAYLYDAYQLAYDYADSEARPAAERARAAAIINTWDPESPWGNNGPDFVVKTWSPTPPDPGVTSYLYASNKSDYNDFFVAAFNNLAGTNFTASGPSTAGANATLMLNGDPTPPGSRPAVIVNQTVFSSEERANGWMSQAEFDSFVTIAQSQMQALAAQNGETAYASTYKGTFDPLYEAMKNISPSWQQEGLGFAAAWDARDPDGNGEYINSDRYTHVEPMVIYDSLGTSHKLMIYYQPNPHMDNVWDYIITCDPLEDARKDANLDLLFEKDATFAGLIQKGKITFTSDGPDRHGGVIKDIEAQNIDFSEGKTKAASINDPTFSTAATGTLRNATIGGYYTGSPKPNPATGVYEQTQREYEVYVGGFNSTAYNADVATWKTTPDYTDPAAGWQAAYPGIDPESSQVAQPPDGAAPNETYRERAMRLFSYPNRLDTGYWTSNVSEDPRTSGLTWFDSDGNIGEIRISDKNNLGPYQFGSGLTLTFDPSSRPLMLGGTPGANGFETSAHSEQIAWTNLTPNKSGYYDFDVAFVSSASMAWHPPYPTGLPTVIQNIAFDMGAKNPNGLLTEWRLDDQSTTQYATKSSTVFGGQDGYPAGSLQRISVGEDGVITGVYTNGRQQSLYQVGLTRFLNPWGLDKMGDNLYADTRYSGPGVMNEPGYGGTGKILGNFLEQSNVDIADEIVNMIVTQRGFQANSKTVTTTDTMLAEVIEMKR
jgi:flagellar hook-basal body protein